MVERRLSFLVRTCTSRRILLRAGFFEADALVEGYGCGGRIIRSISRSNRLSEGDFWMTWLVLRRLKDK